MALEGSSEWSALNISDELIWISLSCDCGVGSSSIGGSTKVASREHRIEVLVE